MARRATRRQALSIAGSAIAALMSAVVAVKTLAPAQSVAWGLLVYSGATMSGAAAMYAYAQHEGPFIEPLRVPGPYIGVRYRTVAVGAMSVLTVLVTTVLAIATWQEPPITRLQGSVQGGMKTVLFRATRGGAQVPLLEASLVRHRTPGISWWSAEADIVGGQLPEHWRRRLVGESFFAAAWISAEEGGGGKSALCVQLVGLGGRSEAISADRITKDDVDALTLCLASFAYAAADDYQQAARFAAAGLAAREVADGVTQRLHTLLGFARMKMRQYHTALHSLRAALQLTPKARMPSHYVLRCLVATGQDKAAIKVGERYIARWAGDHSAQKLLAMAYEAERDYVRAEMCARAAIAHYRTEHPGGEPPADYFVIMARALEGASRAVKGEARTKSEEEALVLCEEALALYPYHAPAHIVRCAIYNKREEWRLLESAAKKGVSACPLSVELRMLLLEAYRRQGQVADAMRIGRTAVRRLPGIIDSFRRKAPPYKQASTLVGLYARAAQTGGDLDHFREDTSYIVEALAFPGGPRQLFKELAEFFKKDERLHAVFLKAADKCQ